MPEVRTRCNFDIVKSGIIIMSELHGPVAERLRRIQAQYDPRMVAELPPHVTVAGSSGMGPIPAHTPAHKLQNALEGVARETPPIVVRFGPAMRFMQSTVVVLPIDPHGPIRALHERIKSSGLEYEPPRFTFTPHLTLSFYPELARERLRELLRTRVDDEVILDNLQAWRATATGGAVRALDIPLTGHR